MAHKEVMKGIRATRGTYAWRIPWSVQSFSVTTPQETALGNSPGRVGVMPDVALYGEVHLSGPRVGVIFSGERSLSPVVLSLAPTGCGSLGGTVFSQMSHSVRGRRSPQAGKFVIRFNGDVQQRCQLPLRMTKSDSQLHDTLRLISPGLGSSQYYEEVSATEARNSHFLQ